MEKIDNIIFNKVDEYDKILPKFSDGRLDYRKSDTCLVLTIFIFYKKKILLLKRSNKVGTYKKKWNTVTGYIDEKKPLYDKIREETQEEIGLNVENISSYKSYNFFEFEDKEIKKKWIIFPAKIKLNKLPKIQLNWEHTEFIWIYPEELITFNIVPKLDLSLKYILKE